METCIPQSITCFKNLYNDKRQKQALLVRCFCREYQLSFFFFFFLRLQIIITYIKQKTNTLLKRKNLDVVAVYQRKASSKVWALIVHPFFYIKQPLHLLLFFCFFPQYNQCNVPSVMCRLQEDNTVKVKKYGQPYTHLLGEQVRSKTLRAFNAL